MNWQEVFAILFPLIAFMGWVYVRIEQKADARQRGNDKRFESIDKRFEAMDKKFEAMDKKFEAKLDALDKKFEAKLDALDKKFEAKFDSLFFEISLIKDRLSRLEGRFDERGYWESRKSTGTDG